MTNATITIGTKVKVVNFHGEQFQLTNKLGAGYIKCFFNYCGEERAEVYFPKIQKRGGYPVEMLRAA